MQPPEKVFTTAAGGAEAEAERRRVDRERDFILKKGMHSSYDTAVRYNLAVTVTKTTYEVETVTDPVTGQSVRASMDDVGPAGSQLTWGAIATVIKLVVGFAIPVNRLSQIIGSPHFSSGKICRVMENVASCVAPIYPRHVCARNAAHYDTVASVWASGIGRKFALAVPLRDRQVKRTRQRLAPPHVKLISRLH